ncbi:MAG: rcc01693 family protein [Celeribacter sp.]|jgi:uncharacterized phage protein (TIGR02216 family)
MGERLDWPGLLRLGLTRLRLRPAEFWALSPVELLLMLGLAPGGGVTPLTRAGLSALEAAFPDERGAEREATDG